MAQRPVYKTIVSDVVNTLYEEIICDFKWFPGYAIVQKQKSIDSLHESANARNISPILEISSKSPLQLGVQLSAFNLCLDTIDFGSISVESAFQGSKKFYKGGPYIDFYHKTGREIKRDSRLKDSGHLVSFEFEGISWDLEPVTAFYDWLYIKALNNNPDLTDQIIQYDGFTDIEFNPKKSINCQAKSCALYVSLYKRNILKDAMGDRSYFLELLTKHYNPVGNSKKGQISMDW